MDRRKFVKTAALGSAAASALAAPALAQTAPQLRWRLTSGFPKSLDTIYGTAELLAKYVGEMTDGRFVIQPFGAGEIIPGLESVDAVSRGTVEMSHTASFYNFGRDPTFALCTSVPFLMGKRAQDGWLYQGEGNGLIQQFLGANNIQAFPAGNTGAQMGGWFRREIRTVADLQGLRFRMGGMAGRIFQRVGVVPQQLAGGDIYPALERGTIDGAEWVGAYDDEKLGLNRVAQFYYYPGWQEGASVLHLMINTAKWNELPKNYQHILENAAAHANTQMMAMYDARNAAALRRLVAAGTQLRVFPTEVLDRLWQEANAFYGEINAQNAPFKRMYDSAVAFRNDFYLYNQISDFAFDSYMMRAIRQRA
jgi:TRAP-type mannitol/chloroaromatic compound transport system substrate-binding protein